MVSRSAVVEPEVDVAPGPSMDVAGPGNAAAQAAMTAPEPPPEGVLAAMMAAEAQEEASAPADASEAPELCGDPGSPAFEPGSMGDGKGGTSDPAHRTFKKWHASEASIGGRVGIGIPYDGITAGHSSTVKHNGTTKTTSDVYNNGYDNFGGTRKKVDAVTGPDGKHRVERHEDRKTLLKGTRKKYDEVVRTPTEDEKKQEKLDAKAKKAKKGKKKADDELGYQRPKVYPSGRRPEAKTDGRAEGTVEVHGKKGSIEHRQHTKQERKDRAAKHARDEAGVTDQMKKGKFGKAMEHVTIGTVGDESGIDLESFKEQRENKLGFAGGEAKVEDIKGGQKASAEGYAGIKASGSAQAVGRDVDAFGNQRVSKAGATAEGFAGVKGGVSASHKKTADGHEVAAKAATKLGMGGEGAAGATTQTRLADKLTAQAGGQIKGSGFVGARGEGSATASHTYTNAKVGGSAEVMAGAEASGEVGAKAGIDGAGFTLAGARADAEGEALVGGVANAKGEVSADVIQGLTASGSAEAFVGARASGKATGGVSLGGVDADAVAEGEAKGSADAAASGMASAGLLGAGAQGKVSAFAGAMAGGEARFELGAGGLNFGALGIAGEVSAGIGANASGKLSAQLDDVGVSGRAGVTYGVGAGVGGTLSVDPSFPVRLTLDKLAENKVIPKAEIGSLITSAASLVYTPDSKAVMGMLGSAANSGAAAVGQLASAASMDVAGPSMGMAAPAPAMDMAGPGAGGASVGMAGASMGMAAPAPAMDMAGPSMGMAAPAPAMDMAPPGAGGASSSVAGGSTIAAAPDEEMSIGELKVEATPDQRRAIGKTEGVIKKQLDKTVPSVLGAMNGVMSAGGGLFGRFMGLLGDAFKASEDAKAAALEGMQLVVQTGLAQAAGVFEQLTSLGGVMVSEITAMITADPAALLNGNWEKAIDEAVERVRTFAESAKAEVFKIIESIRAAIAALAKAAIDAAMSPVRSLKDSVAGVVGGFTEVVGGAGAAMLGAMRDTLEPLEDGVEVEDMGGTLSLPLKVSPILKIAEGPVQEMSTFGRDKTSEAMGTAIDFIQDGLETVVGAESGGLLGGLADIARFVTGGLFTAPVLLAEGAAAIAKPAIRVAVAIFQEIQRAAQAAFGWLGALFGW